MKGLKVESQVQFEAWNALTVLIVTFVLCVFQKRPCPAL